MKPPQKDIDWALDVEKSVQLDKYDLYLDCMDGIPMSQRVESPRNKHDIRDGCILTGIFIGIVKPYGETA